MSNASRMSKRQIVINLNKSTDFNDVAVMFARKAESLSGEDIESPTCE